VCSCGKTAVAVVFPQTKNNTNNFPKNPSKTHKVNSLGVNYSGTVEKSFEISDQDEVKTKISPI
jgi:hypothetical protein